MVRKPNAVLIGPKALNDYFVNAKPEWSWVPNVDTASDFLLGINEGTITSDIEAVFFIDKYYRHDPKSFCEAVSLVVESAMVGIISYDQTETAATLEGIKAHNGTNTMAMEKNLFLIGKANPISDLNNAVEDFVSNNYFEALASINIINGKEPNSFSQGDGSVADSVLNDSEDSDDVPTAEGEVNGVPDTRLHEYRKFFKDTFDFNKPQGRVFSITSSKGGVGKSTLTITTASYIAKESKRLASIGEMDKPLSVVILDMDILDAQVGFFTRTQGSNISHVFSNGISKESLKKNIHTAENLGVDVLLGSNKPELGRIHPDDFYMKVIKGLRSMYDVVILDTSVDYTSNLIGDICYNMSDKVVVITEPVIPSVLSLRRWVDYVTKPKIQGGLELDESKIGIAINRFQKEDKRAAKALNTGNRKASNRTSMHLIQKASKGIPIISIVPFQAVIVSTATNNGLMGRLLDSPGIKSAIADIAGFLLDDGEGE